MTTQREFPFLDVMPAPSNAPRTALAMCASEAEALRVSLVARGKKSNAWFAKALGLSRSYFSELMNGKKAVPEWMVLPLCVLTGTNLLAQYRDWQRAMNIATATETDSQRAERIAAELRRAA